MTDINVTPNLDTVTKRYRVSISDFWEGGKHKRAVFVDGDAEMAEKIADAIGNHDAALARIKTLETVANTTATFLCTSAAVQDNQGKHDNADMLRSFEQALRAALSTTDIQPQQWADAATFEDFNPVPSDAQPEAGIRDQLERRWASLSPGDSDFSAIDNSGSPQPDPRDDLIKELEDAALHALRVFHSMAERNQYPEELLPTEPEFLGKQGFIFLLKALGLPSNFRFEERKDAP